MPSKLKFVSGKTEETVRLNLAWYIRSGYDDSSFGNFMTLGAAAFVQFGIYGIWKNWDDIRRTASVLNISVEDDFVPLAFETSDIHLHFWLYFVCMAVALTVMLVELLAGQC